jgi:hypothetical protein
LSVTVPVVSVLDLVPEPVPVMSVPVPAVSVPVLVLVPTPSAQSLRSLFSMQPSATSPEQLSALPTQSTHPFSLGPWPGSHDLHPIRAPSDTVTTRGASHIVHFTPNAENVAPTQSTHAVLSTFGS